MVIDGIQSYVLVQCGNVFSFFSPCRILSLFLKNTRLGFRSVCELGICCESLIDGRARLWVVMSYLGCLSGIPGLSGTSRWTNSSSNSD